MAVGVKVGDAEVFALFDGRHPFNLEWHYPSIGDEQWAPYTETGPKDLNFGAFLVKLDGTTILVDTGWGPQFAPPGGLESAPQLLDELASIGVAPEDVDVVALTHIHPDHIGWNLIVGDDGSVAPRFPNARYLVPEDDVDHYRRRVDAGERIHPSIIEQGLGLTALDVTELVRDGHEVVPGLRAVHAPGHTPGHTLYVLDSAGERFVVLADIAHHPAVLHETDWVQSFDWEPEQARENRERLLAEFEESGCLLAAGHFPYPSLGRIGRDEDGRRVWIEEDLNA